MAKKAKAKPKPKKTAASVSPRVRKLDRKQIKAKAKKIARSKKPIPGSFKLLGQVFGIFKQFWKTLAGIVLVYLIINVLFASGLSNLSNTVGIIKSDIKTGNSHLGSAINGVGSLFTSAGSGSSQNGSITESVLFALESLVIIWALRQLLAGKAIKVKQAYYQSMTPLVPFLLVCVFIIIQLLPVILGTTLLTLVLTSVLAVSSAVTFVFVLLFIILAAWSAYMVSCSIFALYIVTLPDMQPRQALRSAKNLVRFRRWPVLRRLLFLPVFVLLLIWVLTVPAILFASWLVAPFFYLLTMVAILFGHSYVYNLYRGLLE